MGTVLKLVHGSSDAVGDQIVSHLLVNTAKSPRAGELRSFLQRSSSSGAYANRRSKPLHSYLEVDLRICVYQVTKCDKHKFLNRLLSIIREFNSSLNTFVFIRLQGEVGRE